MAAKKESTLKTLLFATAVSLVAGSLLLFVGMGLKDRIQLNKKVERYSHILRSLGVPLDEGAENRQVVRMYRESVREETVYGVGRFVFEEDGNVRSVAYDLKGMGLWGPIYGFIALEPDLCTVKKVTFYKQEETPGLGAEIVKSAFTNQFKGKKLTYPCDSGEVRLHVRKHGSADKKWEVDGITGATMTTQGVEDLMQAAIKKILQTRKEGKRKKATRKKGKGPRRLSHGPSAGGVEP